jgi:hypothetical protein
MNLSCNPNPNVCWLNPLWSLITPWPVIQYTPFSSCPKMIHIILILDIAWYSWYIYICMIYRWYIYIHLYASYPNRFLSPPSPGRPFVSAALHPLRHVPEAPRRGASREVARKHGGDARTVEGPELPGAPVLGANLAMENSPFIDGPMKNGDFPWLC